MIDSDFQAMGEEHVKRMRESDEKTCCVCGVIVRENGPYEDRWSWGPDGLHCHYRCEKGFGVVLAARYEVAP